MVMKPWLVISIFVLFLPDNTTLSYITARRIRPVVHSDGGDLGGMQVNGAAGQAEWCQILWHDLESPQVPLQEGNVLYYYLAYYHW